MSVKVKKLLYPPTLTSEAAGSLTPEPRGVKLPKIDVPMFDWELLSWQTFWEQLLMAARTFLPPRNWCTCATP